MSDPSKETRLGRLTRGQEPSCNPSSNTNTDSAESPVRIGPSFASPSTGPPSTARPRAEMLRREAHQHLGRRDPSTYDDHERSMLATFETKIWPRLEGKIAMNLEDPSVGWKRPTWKGRSPDYFLQLIHEYPELWSRWRTLRPQYEELSRRHQASLASSAPAESSRSTAAAQLPPSESVEPTKDIKSSDGKTSGKPLLSIRTLPSSAFLSKQRPGLLSNASDFPVPQHPGLQNSRFTAAVKNPPPITGPIVKTSDVKTKVKTEYRKHVEIPRPPELYMPEPPPMDPSLGLIWSSRTAGPHVAPANRPGGKLKIAQPMKNVSGSRYLSKENIRKLKIHEWKLGCASDEALNLCRGIFGNGSPCKWIVEPAKCRMWHSVEQSTLDTLVGSRGLNPAYVDWMLKHREEKVPKHIRDVEAPLHVPRGPAGWSPIPTKTLPSCSRTSVKPTAAPSSTAKTLRSIASIAATRRLENNAGVNSVPAPAPVPAPAVDHVPSSIKIQVDRTTLSTFEAIFDVKREIPWQRFVQAMTKVGFRAEQSHGSACNFFRSADDVMKEKKIQFHKPHPEPKITGSLAKNMRRRLKRHELTLEIFELA